MSKTHAPSGTSAPTLVLLTALDMNHIRGGMATMDSEKTKRIRTNGVRHGWDKDWKEDKEDKPEKIKKIKD
jgi:hypothetical protein